MIDVVRLLESLGVAVSFERGGELWACCPLPGHSEKTPSWSINDKRNDRHGLWSCFGCDEAGTPADLVMAVVGFATYAAAKNWIEERGLDVEDPVALAAYVEVLPNKYDLFFMPREVKWVGVMSKWPTPVRRKLAARGVTADEVAEWNIGYAADGPLANRVVVPFHDEHGALQSYSARAMWTLKRGESKYLTARKRDGADHGAVFGALHWPQPGLPRDRVFVTEGVFNALAVRRVLPGAHVAALDGSEVVPGQLLALSTFAEVVVCSDPDGAGDALYAKLAPAGRWRKLRRVHFPAGVDANDLERSDPALLRRLLTA